MRFILYYFPFIKKLAYYSITHTSAMCISFGRQKYDEKYTGIFKVNIFNEITPLYAI